MAKGILLCGLNGTGKSTLNHILAMRMGYAELDAEDFYFPSQREARMTAMDSGAMDETIVPYQNPRSKQEVQQAILRETQNSRGFILSGVKADWDAEILSQIVVAFWVRTPDAERMRRIEQREIQRFGSRVLAGGDLFAEQQNFRKMAAQRKESMVEESLQKLHCPVFQLDGMIPPAENAEKILKCIQENLQNIKIGAENGA